MFLLSNVSAEDNYREIYRVTLIDLQYDDNGTLTVPTVWALGHRLIILKVVKIFSK